VLGGAAVVTSPLPHAIRCDPLPVMLVPCCRPICEATSMAMGAFQARSCTTAGWLQRPTHMHRCGTSAAARCLAFVGLCWLLLQAVKLAVHLLPSTIHALLLPMGRKLLQVTKIFPHAMCPPVSAHIVSMQEEAHGVANQRAAAVSACVLRRQRAIGCCCPRAGRDQMSKRCCAGLPTAAV
jgi:hypothetical protein